MRCPYCHTELAEGFKFCKECGADGWVTKAEEEMAKLS